MIRWRRPGDDASIVRLVKDELVPLSSRSGMRGRRLRQEIAERLRGGSTLVVSRTARSEPFAFLHMQVRGSTLYIDLLAVDASWQNRSLGTVLMNRAELFALGQGCTEARVFVDDTNERGLRFYAKLGYYTVRHIPGPDCYELAKPLPASWT